MTDESGDPNAPTGPDSEPTEGTDGTPTGRSSTDPGADADGDGSDAGAPDPSPSDEAASTVPPRLTEPRRESAAPPRPKPGSRAAGGDESLLTRFRTARSGPLLFIRETIYSALGVLAVGLLLFAISGVWPPMVAVESGSMEPEMQRGDLIFVTDPERFTPDYAQAGIVTVEVGTDEGYRSFDGNGSVIIYDPPDRVGSPIIHRAHFHVEAGENWYDRANPAYLNADDCESLSNCPAPHDGFITKGDANARYDQASNIAGPVRPEWVRGTARLRIPYLGHIRLRLAGTLAT
jgi:signal peptidase